MEHLTANEVAGYLDGDLSSARRRQIRQHLEDCDSCRAEVVEVARLLDRAVSAHRRVWRVPAGIAAASAAAVIALLLVQPATQSDSGQVERERFAAEGVQALAAHTPADDAVITRSELAFAWQPHGGAYRLTVTARDGALAWSQTVADTLLVLPQDLELAPGQRYFWYVDAIGAGRMARSDVRSFVIAP